MLQKIKDSWRQFTDSEPGQRFEDRYNRRHENAGGGFNAGLLLHIGAGIVVTLAGLFFLPAPGPGTLILLAGLGLIGGEFLPVARFMDRAEVKVREWTKPAKEAWNRLSPPVKIVLGLIALACGATVMYWGYHLLFGGSKR